MAQEELTKQREKVQQMELHQMNQETDDVVGADDHSERSQNQ